MNDSHQATTPRDIKQGEYVRFKVNGPVWIRDSYDRSSGKYEFISVNDLCRTTYKKGDSVVYIGFDY